MNVLGIETSCDETAAAVVSTTGDAARPWALRSNVIASQVDIHREWGGVVPEIASRQHVRDICGVVERALQVAELDWSGVDAIAVTQGPGLAGSLLVGVAFAKATAAALGKPVIAVHHLAGHIESIVLQHGEMPLPAVVLVVSGGHTSLYCLPEPGVYRLIGRTRDDAAGEAYDKVARLLGLGYPGGPVIDKLARDGDDQAIALPRPKFTHADRNAPPPDLARDLAGHGSRIAEFSFSGLKTAVGRELESRGVAVRTGLAVPTSAGRSRRRTSPTSAPASSASWSNRSSIGRSRPCTPLARRAWALPAASRPTAGCGATRPRAVNARAFPSSCPALALSTDNAAMIAAAGLRRLERSGASALDFNAEAALPMPA